MSTRCALDGRLCCRKFSNALAVRERNAVIDSIPTNGLKSMKVIVRVCECECCGVLWVLSTYRKYHMRFFQAPEVHCGGTFLAQDIITFGARETERETNS